MFCNEKKQAQIHVLRNFLDDMEQDISKDSVVEDLQRLINSKSCDLREIRESPRTNTFDFGKDTPEIIRRIARDAMGDVMEDAISFTTLSLHDAFDISNKFEEKLDELIDHPERCDSIRRCDECGKLMFEGYCLGGGEEYYCSDECLHENYSHEEFLAMYAGLDNTDPAEVERASKMSQEELDRLSDENDSQSYYTDWEI
jgi:hypothetical protein